MPYPLTRWFFSSGKYQTVIIIDISTQYIYMDKKIRYFCVLIALLIAALCVLPVSAAVETKPSISTSLSAVYIKAGQPITVMGIATGTVTEGVQVWIFAGNYVNVSIVPVNPSGTFSTTYNTSGLPPAKYYVIVQHPGSDNSLQITSSGYSGQVINKKTNATIFSFTGTGSVTDAAAVTALSNAFSAEGVDDIYAKQVFTILPENETVPTYPGTIAPGSATPATQSGTAAATTVVPAATKSPVAIVTVLAGIALALGAAMYVRKQ
ncbi:MAG: hypothetical protein WAK10_00755 [Methanoregula sp.]